MEKLKKLYEYKQFKIILGILALFIVMIVCITIYYSDKFYPNTTVNGIDVSGLTYKEASTVIEKQLTEYKTVIQGRNDGSLEIKGTDIELTYDYKKALKKTLNKQHAGISFYKVLTENTLTSDFNVSINTDKTKELINKSELIEETDNYKIQEPVSAHVEYDETTGLGKIVEEVQGNTLNKDNLYSYVEKQITKLSTEIALEDGDVYSTPKYTTESEEVTKELETYNMYLLKWIQWDMGEDTTETMTPEDIKDCLTITDDAQVEVDKDKLEDWIEEFCLKYKTVGTTRNFTTHSGQVIQISGGDYGWRMDFDKTVDQAYDAITKEVDSSLTNAYIEEKSDENKKALTTSLEPIWSNTAYTKDYTNFSNDWNTQNYSEVDLSAQYVYVYKNGKLAFSCRCVTGLAGDSSRATKTGVYYIKDKKLEYTLTGDDYTTPTKYWVRIMWTGTGYHYMNRSDWGSWSPSLYKTKGSHGCINLEYDSAKTIYSLVSMRDPVFIHY